MLLSPRTIHFCENEVIWDCCTVRKSQSGCHDKTHDPVKWTRQQQQQLQTSPSAKPSGKTIQSWHQTVEEYSQRKLTFARDRLPALAGISQRMHNRRPNDAFLAGLWEHSLVLDLLWETRGSPEPCPVVKFGQWTAPTWSWASIATGVGWIATPDNINAAAPLAEVLNKDIQAVGSQYLGETTRARLALRGPLIPGSLSVADGGPYTRPTGRVSFCFTGQYLGWHDSEDFRRHWDNEELTPDFKLSMREDTMLHSTAVFVLPVYASLNGALHYCLVLRESGSAPEERYADPDFGCYLEQGSFRYIATTFERIGMLHLYNPEIRRLQNEVSEKRLSLEGYDAAVKGEVEKRRALLAQVKLRTFWLV
jgi:hypothetical protein